MSQETSETGSLDTTDDHNDDNVGNDIVLSVTSRYLLCCTECVISLTNRDFHFVDAALTTKGHQIAFC
jgi:hypothetical protein